jgi:hypothetical protein
LNGLNPVIVIPKGKSSWTRACTSRDLSSLCDSNRRLPALLCGHWTGLQAVSRELRDSKANIQKPIIPSESARIVIYEYQHENSNFVLKTFMFFLETCFQLLKYLPLERRNHRKVIPNSCKFSAIKADYFIILWNIFL